MENFPLVSAETRGKIDADHAKYEKEKAKIAAAYNDSLKAAEKYNKGVRDSVPGNIKYDSWAKEKSPNPVDGETEFASWNRAGVTPQPEAVPEPERVAVDNAMPPAPGVPAGAERGRQPEAEREAPIGAAGAEVLRGAVAREQEALQNGERRSVWGWLKERAKGFFTLGWWEHHQAEKFRSGTKRTAEEVTARASLLGQTRDMDIEAARDEANRIGRMVGGPPRSMTRDDIEAASSQIDAEKTHSNARIMDYIVAQARGNVAERLTTYRNQWGQHIVGPEQLAQFENSLRAELHSSTIGRGIREQSILKREIDFKRAVRERLDPHYWLRYVYGTAETALWAVGVYLATPYIAQWLAGGGNAMIAPGAIPAPGSPDQMLQMQDTIWKTSKEWIQSQLGVPNLTDAQIWIFQSGLPLIMELACKSGVSPAIRSIQT